MAKPLLLNAGGALTESLAGTVSGQVATWSAAAGAWVAGPGSASGGGGQVFYFNFDNVNVSPEGLDIPQSTTSTPSTNPSLLGPTYNPISTSVTSANLVEAEYRLIAGFLTASGSPNTDYIPGGLWDFNLWAAATAATNGSQVQMQARVYIANAAGTQYGSGSGSNDQLPLASSDAVYLYEQATIAQYILNVTTPATVIDPTDRLYIEIWGQKNTNQTRTITLSFASNQPSHVHTTILVPVDLATDVTGVLPLANGGTGKALTAGNGVVYSDADSMEILASASGDDGKFLKSNGTSPPSWATVVTTQSYDLRGAFIGNPATGLVIDTFVADRVFAIAGTSAHQFYCAVPPATGQTVVVTVAKKAISDGAATTLFTATFKDSATNPIAGNGLYPATLAAGTDSSFAAGDLVTVTVGTTNASFQSPVWTIYGTA